MKDNLKIQPSSFDENILVQFSDSFILDKHVLITVPADFDAHFCSEEKWVAKLENVNNENLLKLVGKDFKNSKSKIAFIRKISLPLIPWGFGDVRVKNNKLEQSYRVGCNGKYQLRIDNISKLIKAFGANSNITVELLEEKTKPMIEPIARPILSDYFVNNNISIFEVESKLDEITNEIVSGLKRENIFKELGVMFNNITVNKIHIPEEDFDSIKSSYNKSNNIDLESFKTEILNSIKSVDLGRLDALEKKISSLLESNNNDNIIDQIDNLRTEMREAFKTIKNTGDKETEQIMKEKEAELEREFNNLKENYLSISTMLDQAKNDDDYATIAARICSNVENNFIEVYKLPHHNSSFYISELMFDDMYDSLVGKNNQHRPFKKRVIVKDQNGSFVEMPPLLRFVKTGLSNDDAMTATSYWSILGSIKHRNDRNESFVGKRLAELGFNGKKDFLRATAEFYKKHNLYTK